MLVASSAGRLDLSFVPSVSLLPRPTPVFYPFLSLLSLFHCWESITIFCLALSPTLSYDWNGFLWTRLCNNLAKFLRCDPRKSLQFLNKPSSVAVTSLSFLLLSPPSQPTGLLKIFHRLPRNSDPTISGTPSLNHPFSGFQFMIDSSLLCTSLNLSPFL